MKKLFVVDGNSIINRAYYGIRPLTTKDGMFTNAIYGFLTMLEKIYATLEEGKCARTLEFSKEEKEILKEISLLTLKPVIYAANVSEDDFVNGIEENTFVNELSAIANEEGSEVLPICARIEEEISELEEDEKIEFLKELGIEESGLNRLIKKSYHLLGLISYLTAGEPEVRAWTIKKGTKAPQAAGVIHSDFERGFIRAEVIRYEDFIQLKSEAACRAAGKLGIEGKEYVVQDGDIMHFLFNV